MEPSTPPTMAEPWLDTPLAERDIRSFTGARVDLGKGRRLRVFAMLVGNSIDHWGKSARLSANIDETRPAFIYERDTPITYAEAYDILKNHEKFKDIPLRANFHDRPLHSEWRERIPVLGRDPDLHMALHDLAYEINEDITEACAAFDNPDLYFPGIDEGIEPVPDDHVELVMWALQRELNRERRPPQDENGRSMYGQGLLAPLPLTDLPWRIQRALAERRRYRFTVEYGITKEKWQAGTWDLMSVREDSDFVPRRWLRQ